MNNDDPVILTPAELTFLHGALTDAPSAIALELGVDEQLRGSAAFGHGMQSLTARQLVSLDQDGAAHMSPLVAAVGACLTAPDRSIVLGRQAEDAGEAVRIVQVGEFGLLLSPAPVGNVLAQPLDLVDGLTAAIVNLVEASAAADDASIVVGVEVGQGSTESTDGVVLAFDGAEVRWRMSCEGVTQDGKTGRSSLAEIVERFCSEAGMDTAGA